MTTFRSSLFRPFGGLLKGSAILGLLLAGWMGFVATVMWSHERHPRPFLKAAVVRHPLFALPAALTLLIGLPTLAATFARSRGRYRLGPTELEIGEGWLGRSLKTVPYADIESVQTSRGPLMRLLGTSDLTIATGGGFPTTLFGVRGADEIRDHLLSRRESLRELRKAEQEDSSLRAVERLSKVLERLEKRLGPSD
jgi:membrane protein YdbS with pleckstrin-like domain